MILQHLVSGSGFLMLLASAAGALLAVAYLVADYLLFPVLRLRAAGRRGSGAVGRLLDRERSRLALLRDTAAVAEEHGRPDLGALREEVALRAAVLLAMERSASGVPRRPRWAPELP